MLPTDPFFRPGQFGDEDVLGPNAQLGWGEAAPFPYDVNQGAGAAMPPPGPPPAAPPAQSLMDAAQARAFNPAMFARPPAALGGWRNAMEDLQRRQRPMQPRPNPLRAAALIELGKLMAENGRTMKQHHALLEAYHAMRGPSQGGYAT